MTMPEENKRAVIKTRQFLAKLQTLNFREAGTAHWVRTEARILLRHYPLPEDTERAARSLKLWDLCALTGYDVEELIFRVVDYYNVLAAANREKRAKRTAKSKGARP